MYGPSGCNLRAFRVWAQWLCTLGFAAPQHVRSSQIKPAFPVLTGGNLNRWVTRETPDWVSAKDFCRTVTLPEVVIKARLHPTQICQSRNNAK